METHGKRSRFWRPLLALTITLSAAVSANASAHIALPCGESESDDATSRGMSLRAGALLTTGAAGAGTPSPMVAVASPHAHGTSAVATPRMGELCGSAIRVSSAGPQSSVPRSSFTISATDNSLEVMSASH